MEHRQSPGPGGELSVANKPQHQGSLTDQLRELVTLANQNGLYDAADYIQRRLEEQNQRRKGARS